MNLSAILICAAIAAAGAALAAPDEKAVISLEAGIPETLVRNNVTVELIKGGARQGLQVQYGVTDWPNAFFRPVIGVWDWSGWTGIAVDVFNPEPEAQTVNMRVDNAGADGVTACNQLTGKSNYIACSEDLEVDLIENPDYLITPEGAARSAAWFWSANDLNKYADSDDIVGCTKRVNGGTIGLEERTELYDEAKALFG
jgi:hypothetical protein